MNPALQLFEFHGDPWLAGIAALLGVLGCGTSLRLLSHASGESRHVGGQDPMVRRAWIFMAALVAGTTIWTVHFICMLAQAAYASHMVGGYNATLTILSLCTAVGGTMAAFTLATARPQGAWAVPGGMVLGGAVAAMHYLGLHACTMTEAVRWNMGLALASVPGAMGLGGLTLAVARGRGPSWLPARLAPMLFLVLIFALHVGPMDGLSTPGAVDVHAAAPADTVALALATALGAGLIVVGGGFVHLIDERTRRGVHAQVEAAISTDRLTGLPNRPAFEREVARRVQLGETFGIITMQVANIEAINHQFGVKVGDLVIQAMRDRLRMAAKQGVFLARTGGAQLSGAGVVADRDEMLERATRLHHALSAEMLVEGSAIAIDLRLGAAAWPIDTQDAETLVRQAQAALARALADPLAVIALHDEKVNTRVQRRLTLAQDLHHASERGELELHYQPQVWLADFSVIGYEALLRWRHPQLGMIPPVDFIPIAEKTGAIVPIGLWVLQQACRAAALWETPSRIAVNVSPLQLRQPDLPRQILETLFVSGLAPDRLEIEVTESLLIEDEVTGLSVLQQIRALGVKIALDDFGTGYSSMDILRKFPFDKVKLDKGFMKDIESSSQGQAILRAMLELGRGLSIPVLVEGVETPRQLAILRKEGCQKAQGYLIGRPSPVPLLAPGAVYALG